MKIVVALGGNALGNTPEEQLKLVKNTAKQIVKMVSAGHEVIIVHGNGPQVGMINLAFDNAYQNEAGTPLMPFAECGAMSQGYIGYHLQQAISDELKRKKINKECLTIITQVLVDKSDKAFNNPTKPVGMFYNKKEADEIAQEKGYIFVEDAKRGYRRVVPSPKPQEIIELDVIEDIVNKGNIVITCGGGGIPVIKEGNKYTGVDAVIDKDNAAALLALELDADMLLILTAVSNVCINYKTPNEQRLKEMTLEETYKYIDEEQFAKGSMLPKIEACCKFVENSNNGEAIIAALSDGEKALVGKSGTKIVKEKNKKTIKKRKFTMPSAYTILILSVILLGIATRFLPTAVFDENGTIVNGSGVIAATLSQILKSPLLGFIDAVGVCLFMLMLGAFLKVVIKTEALQSGIAVLVKKLKGKELLIIPILMFIFSICGTTYGMQAEAIGFYALLSATMVAAGMDTIVATATILLGAGVGVLGSTVNPFAVGAALEALPDGIEANQGIIIAIGVILWLTSYTIATLFVMQYAAKVKKDKGSTFLSLQEQKQMEKTYGKNSFPNDIKLTKKQKITLWIFGIAFLIMILGFVPWENLGINIFSNLPHNIIGISFGNWSFLEASLWFLLITIIICIVNRFTEKETVETFVDGADDMVGVILIVAIARGVSVLMKQTYLDNYLIYTATDLLKNLPAPLYTIYNYLLHIILSFLVPSSSGMSALSTPIIAPLAVSLGYSVEANIMIIVAANGLVNLITPTCGAIVAGLALAKVEYQTWFKWSWKLMLTLMLSSIVILTLAMLIF